MNLSGLIYITDSIDIIYNLNLGPQNKIINLDEDGILPESSSSDIIGGQCLLPPIAAKIAEADSDEILYDSLYRDHLLAPYQQAFIGALISFLYKTSGKLILFLPELGSTVTCEKLVEHLYTLYGIHIGIINNPDPIKANCFYNAQCIPIWLNLIYSSNVISGYEYLYEYPADAVLTNNTVMMKLIHELRPYGETINEQINEILKLKKLIHKNPQIKFPLLKI